MSAKESGRIQRMVEKTLEIATKRPARSLIVAGGLTYVGGFLGNTDPVCAAGLLTSVIGPMSIYVGRGIKAKAEPQTKSQQ